MIDGVTLAFGRYSIWRKALYAWQPTEFVRGNIAELASNSASLPASPMPSSAIARARRDQYIDLLTSDSTASDSRCIRRQPLRQVRGVLSIHSERCSNAQSLRVRSFAVATGCASGSDGVGKSSRPGPKVPTDRLSGIAFRDALVKYARVIPTPGPTTRLRNAIELPLLLSARIVAALITRRIDIDVRLYLERQSAIHHPNGKRRL